MANKSGTSEQIISHPNGGGSLNGLGETFSPDLFTGTGNFSVPISVPPGRNGFQPDLNLVYSTGNGNSPFGLGWQISVPGIERKTSKGIPQYKEEDVFVLSGAEDLIPVQKGQNYIQYQPRTEGLFAVIRHFHDEQNDYWEVKSKDGLISRYGSPAMRGIDPATIYDPEDPTHIFSWRLTETKDPFGNLIRYSYLRDLQQIENRHWNQLYLEKIQYVNYEGIDNQTQFLAEVRWIYDSDREDAFSVYRSGFEVRTTRRCRKIEVYSHPGEEKLIRSYNLGYIQAALNKISLLTQVELEGFDEPGFREVEKKMPPLVFSYTPFEPIGNSFQPVGGKDMPHHSLGSPDTELIDLFGNGLPDIVQMNGRIRYWRNLGNGQYSLPREMPQAPAAYTLADPQVQFMDVNGEGKADLVISGPGNAGYFPTRYDASWDTRSFTPFRQVPSFNLFDPEVKLVDLDGDGVTDAIRSGRDLEHYFNDPEHGWRETRFVSRQNMESFPNVNFSDLRVRLGDMTGDNLQDILLITNGNIVYWPNMGHGKWGRRIPMKNSPRFPSNFDPSRILVGDIAGDGLADIIYVDHCDVTIWINQNGNGYSDPIKIAGTPSVSDIDSVRLVDLNGVGVSGILWTSDRRLSQRSSHFFLDLTGGVKPYLLNRMDNNMGAETRIEYRSSIWYYLQDEKGRNSRWNSPLPFPVQVVACVEVLDKLSLGKLTTEYSYHHGYWDGAEREFRGFGRVDQVDTQTFQDFNSQGLHGETSFESVEPKHYSPPVLSKTWFHQGPIGEGHGEWEILDYSHEYWQGDSNCLSRFFDLNLFLSRYRKRRIRRDAVRTLKGSILRTELYALDRSPRENTPYTVTESQYGLREIRLPEDIPRRGMSGAIFFPYALASRTTQWERGDDPMTQFSFSLEYDNFGQPTKQIAIACPRGWKQIEDRIGEDTPFLSTYAHSVYANSNDPNIYIKNRVAQTTQYEILHRGNQRVLDILGAVEQSTRLDLIGQSFIYYDGEAFVGLPLGECGLYGAAVRTETLVLTEEIIQKAFQDEAGNALVPPYLNRDEGYVNWTNLYPSRFQNSLPVLLGYTWHDGSGVQAEGYFVQNSRVQYDFHLGPNGRGLPITNRDPLGRDTHIQYDAYQLLPESVLTPYNLSTEAKYDYRVFQPERVTDPNGNQTAFTFHPLGLLRATAIMGKEGEDLGDSLEHPGTRLEYDFHAFIENGNPISIATTVREHHIHDTHIPESSRHNTIKSVEYSDGFGRVIQSRIQAEEVHFEDSLGLPINQDQPTSPAEGQVLGGGQDRVVVSGWQVYDNKGQVVKKYEPFFDIDWDFNPPQDDQLGQFIEMFYDPRGQVIRTLNPDGSEQWVIYGIPINIQTPDEYQPTPWEAYTYDANDLALSSTLKPINGVEVPLTERAAPWHYFTPAHIEIDGLGRTIRSVERNRTQAANPGDPLPAIEEYITLSSYDIRGNLVEITDAKGRKAFEYVYDLADQSLKTESIDAGWSFQVIDGLGNSIETRDEKGAITLSAYDQLNRPLHLWAQDGGNQPMSLRQKLFYAETDGSGITQAEAFAQNKRGKLLYHYDEAGLLAFVSYDFKGNLLEKFRRTISHHTILDRVDFQPPTFQIQAFQIEWENTPGTSFPVHIEAMLDPKGYTTTSQFDALNRIIEMQYPEDVEGERKTFRPSYNRAGALESVSLNDAAYVERIAYNAKGQRTLIAYGNRVMTRYVYDADTFRLVRLRSDPYDSPSPLVYRPSGAKLQDFAYSYDLAGNITQIKDRTRGGGIPGSGQGWDALDRTFSYDALYRLTFATGREQDLGHPNYPWEEAPRSQDPTLTRPYHETYRYDEMGNMLALIHRYGEQGFTRTFHHQASNNRLRHLHIGNGQNTQIPFQYDATGNLIQEATNRQFEWNHSNELKVFRNQTPNALPTVYALYQYDAGGQRMRKMVWKNGGSKVEITTYIDGVFEHYQVITPGGMEENNQLHIMDDQQRIAILRVGPVLEGEPNHLLKYHLGDHLGSSHLVVNGDGSWINREEYTPYGETSFGSFARKRYRYSGKERDEESGLYYYGARYYGAWMGKWMSCDPLGRIESENLYLYVLNNPIRLKDEFGLQTSSSNPPPPFPETKSNPFNFIVEGPAKQNLETAIHQVLEKEFKGGTLEKNLELFEKKVKSLPKGSDKKKGTAQNYARKFYNKVRRKFNMLEYENPSFRYTEAQRKNLKDGKNPNRNIQYHHLEEIAVHPEKALRPESLVMTEGGPKGGLSKNSPHGIIHERVRRSNSPSGSRGGRHSRPHSTPKDVIKLLIGIYITHRALEAREKSEKTLTDHIYILADNAILYSDPVYWLVGKPLEMTLSSIQESYNKEADRIKEQHPNLSYDEIDYEMGACIFGACDPAFFP